MDIKTNIPEIDAYLDERLKSLPDELVSAIESNEIFDALPTLLTEYQLASETVESIKHEILLILLRILPLDELSATLVSEHDIELQDAVAIANTIQTRLLQKYTHLLTNLPDDEEDQENNAPATNKEPEDQQPSDRENVRPLTREELMSSLSPDHATNKNAGGAQPPEQVHEDENGEESR